jgi:hypothetical protein
VEASFKTSLVSPVTSDMFNVNFSLKMSEKKMKNNVEQRF